MSRNRPVLMIDGWVEYPYSQTMFAAWQANADINAPSLDVRDANGNWQTLLEQFGYPAGMPRRMALPLEKLPEGPVLFACEPTRRSTGTGSPSYIRQENDGS